MSDSLKNHIDTKREDFEIYPFDVEAGWNQISNKVQPRAIWPGWKWISVAACVIFVIAGVVVQSVEIPNGELSEVERYYETEINEKITLVRSQLSDPSILQDLEAMDMAFAELKADLRENVDNEEVIVAMMENYQLKLQILEEILRELEKENSESSL